jgi:hypothetical protein
LASATAQATGWPPKVTPWLNDVVPSRKGSASRSLIITPPSGA